MQTTGHQVVHYVIFGGDRVKYTRDTMGFLVLAHRFKTEMCGACIGLLRGVVVLFSHNAVIVP